MLQSSLVAAPVAAIPSSERGIADAYVGDATVTFVSRPRRAPDDDSGLWIARHLVQGAVTLHINRLLGFRLTGFDGLHQGAMQAAPTSLRNPGQDVNGFGFGQIVAIPIGAHALLLTSDLGVMSVPSYVECVGDCEGEIKRGEQRDSVVHAVASFGYAFRFTPELRPQLTLTLQNHPTNREEFSSSSVDAEVFVGPLYATATIALEWQPLPWLALVPALQWPVTRSPIEYGPIIGLGVRGIAPGFLQTP